MTIPTGEPWTVEAFLAWEARQATRYEFDGVRPIAMTGGTAAHATVQRNLAIAVGGRLRGRPCRFFGSDLKIETLAGHVRYPDGFVVCVPVPPRATVVREPVIVFEVLSPATARRDRITKLREYQATPSICRYVILEQDFAGATVIERCGEDWIMHVLADGDRLRLPEAGIELPLAELYDGVEIDAEAAS